MATGALAQPTGNPSGTSRPDVRGKSEAKPATRVPGATGLEGERQAAPHQQGAATNPDNPAARSGHARTPGSGTAGGLSGRHPNEGRSGQAEATPPADPPPARKAPAK